MVDSSLPPAAHGGSAKSALALIVPVATISIVPGIADPVEAERSPFLSSVGQEAESASKPCQDPLAGEEDSHVDPPTHMFQQSSVHESALPNTFANAPDEPFPRITPAPEESNHEEQDYCFMSEDTNPAAPQWFLEHCVKTAEELKDQDIGLRIRDNENPCQEAPATDELSDVFEVDAAVYGMIRYIHRGQTLESGDHESDFRYDAAYVRYPLKKDIPKPMDPLGPYGLFGGPALGPGAEPGISLSRGTNAFLTRLVTQFAKDSKADLIALNVDDLKDLAAHFADQQKIHIRESAAPLLEYEVLNSYFRSNVEDEAGSEEEAGAEVEVIEPAAILLHAITSAPAQKRPQESAQESHPLVIHIADTLRLQSALYLDYEHFLDHIRVHIKKIQKKYRGVVIMFTSPDHGQCETRSCLCQERLVLQRVGNTPMQNGIHVVPTRSSTQLSLFTKHQEREKSYESSNIRKLQYRVRTSKSQALDMPLLSPYASWDFMGEAISYLAEHEMTADVIDQLVEYIGDCYEAMHIRASVLSLKRRQEVVEAWWPAMQEHHEGARRQNIDKKWVGFPGHVKEAVSQIEMNPHKFDLERTCLDYLVNPQDIDQGWSHIAVEPRIKDAVLQLTDQLLMSKDSAYGILKRGRIAGALLYGPPGTGKTQLARIISCECNAALISVSGAELNRKYVGETEKFVKALFKLGQMLYPSIVFIDEADSIFPSRDRITLEYDRSRINQLLTEMDGFVQSSNAPFTLLATNFPQHLDHAVLRRVPSLLHLGLPLLETRKRIFDLYLCQEILHDDVDTWILARKTHGYSGSDIKNLCVQAALGCRTFVTREGKRMRHLRDEHFHDALRRCSSTVSRTSLAEIHDLAIEHDPHSLVATVEDEVDKGGIFERALRAPALQDMDLD